MTNKYTVTQNGEKLIIEIDMSGELETTKNGHLWLIKKKWSKEKGVTATYPEEPIIKLGDKEYNIMDLAQYILIEKTK
jgi:hypothetical protein